MKVLKWVSENILFVITLFLLAFIPLYPKLPILNVQHTWVYVRLEDFLISAVVLIWFVLLVRKKATFKTPLTIPIIIFWSVGLISVVYAINFIFPYIANVFPNIALLHYLRRIEYISLFFIAFSAVRNKRFVPVLTAVLTVTLLLVTAYGFGQRGILVGWEHRFPAFSTMNEEFAKGIPLLISATNRVQSTFAGHYDLAAYLVMIIPIVGSMIFSFRNIFIKLGLFAASVCGLVLLLMTASRVSFMVYLFAISFMLILQKQKKFIIPVFIFSILLLNSFQGISQRFGSTISQVDLVVDARTGKPIGIAKNTSPAEKKTAPGKQGKQTAVVIEKTDLTGESLPQGSGYINIPANETEQKTVTKVTYIKTRLKSGMQSTEITNVEGDFVIKKVLAYDISFTTRFQGEWPRAFEAFKRNMLLGSGYSSISLATDNNYLRILGETGAFGLASFMLVFLIIGIYVYKVLPDVGSTSSRSYVLGVMAGIFGLGLNAMLIDVFEASKIAFVLWLLIGSVIGLLSLYQKRKINFVTELRNVLLSRPAIILYIFIAGIGVLSITFNNYFVGDDFTWLRWADDCKKITVENISRCEPVKSTIINYFTNSNGFFYRPGTKLYFSIVYPVFWLNPPIYHMLLILIHILNASLVFLLSLKLLKNKFFSLLIALFFLFSSAHSESVFWIATTGHLIASAMVLLAFYLYILWRESKKWPFLIFSLLSVVSGFLFHEFAVISPLIIIAYDFIGEGRNSIKNFLKKIQYTPYFLATAAYLVVRYVSNTHWFNGDYSYNLAKLPLNTSGNILGYAGISLIGSRFLPYYEIIRSFGRGNTLLIVLGLLIFSIVLFYSYKFLFSKMKNSQLKIILLGTALFTIPLLPFLGLGNISTRYIYLGLFGFLILLVFLIRTIWERLLAVNKFTAFAVTFLIIVSYLAYNIFELKRVNEDWKKAGETSNKILVSFNETYVKTRATTNNPVFYLVNIPMKTGEAWIFPVGLPDALWFTFQTENLTVHISKSLGAAFDSAEGSSSAKVFDFDKEGNVEEVFRTKEIIPVNKNSLDK